MQSFSPGPGVLWKFGPTLIQAVTTGVRRGHIKVFLFSGEPLAVQSAYTTESTAIFTHRSQQLFASLAAYCGLEYCDLHYVLVTEYVQYRARCVNNAEYDGTPRRIACDRARVRDAVSVRSRDVVKHGGLQRRVWSQVTSTLVARRRV